MIRLVATPASRDVRELREFFRKIRNPDSGTMEEVGAVVREGFAENFQGEREGSGRAWNPLARSTVKERLRLGFPGAHPILVRTGRYRMSFLERGGDHIAERSITSSGWTVEEGSGDFRVGWLEEGTGTIPARQALLLSRQAEERLGNFLDATFDALSPG